MKKAYALFLGLFPSIIGTAATNGLVPLRWYSWSESSEYVRIGKDLLERIATVPVTTTNFNAMPIVLRPEFVAAMSLTSEETERVSTALAKALHEYRTIQGQHFESIDEAEEFDKALNEPPYPSGTFRFRLKPFESEAGAIREKLKSEVLRTLGPQRANFFWLEGEMYLDSQMNTTNQARFGRTTYAFRLMENDPGPLVDIKFIDPGGSGGRPYGDALDQYAPEKLKPILKRWRDWIDERPPGSFKWSPPESEQVVIEPAAYRKLLKWNDTLEYVDLPKTVVRALKVPGLGNEEEISPEAIAFLGLTTNEVKAVTQAYQTMKERFEQLERANFVRPDAKEMSFVIRAFPEQTTALKKEWLTRLKDLLGASRGELLDQCLRTPVFFSARRLREDIAIRRLRMDAGPRWFDRGMFAMRIDISKGAANWEVRYKSDSGEGGGGSGPKLSIPARFRHLLTPEMLELPKVF